MVLRCHRCWGAHATCKMVRGARSAQRGFRSGRPAVRESTKRCSGRLPCRKPSDASTRRFRAAPRRATHMRRPGRCVTPAPRVRAPAACRKAAHESTNLSCGRGGARLRVQRAAHRFCDAGDAAGHMRCAGACGERRVQVAACRAAWLVRTSLHTDLRCGGALRSVVTTVKRAVHRFRDAGDAVGHMRRAGTRGERRVQVAACRAAWLVRTSLHTDPLRSAVPRRAVSTLK